MERTGNITAINPLAAQYPKYGHDIALLRNAIFRRQEKTVWLPTARTFKEVNAIFDGLLCDDCTHYTDALNRYLFVTDPDTHRLGVQLQYALDADTFKREKEEIERASNAALEQVRTFAKSDPLTTALAIGIYLVERTQSILAENSSPSYAQISRSQTLAGVFIDHRACCLGFARAYAMLCRKAGLECYIALGQGAPWEEKDDPLAQAREELSDTINATDVPTIHSWNYVVVGKIRMYVDLIRSWVWRWDMPDNQRTMSFAMSKQSLFDFGYRELPGLPFPDTTIYADLEKSGLSCFSYPRDLFHDDDEEQSAGLSEQASNVTAITPLIQDKKYDEYKADIELLRSAISNREEGPVWLPNAKAPEQAEELLQVVTHTYNVNGLSPEVTIMDNLVNDGYGIKLEYSLDADTMKREKEEVERIVDSLLERYNTIEDAADRAIRIALDLLEHAENLFVDCPNPTLSQIHRGQTLEGVFIDRRACSLGFARAYEMLCRRAGLACYIVFGNRQIPEANMVRVREETSRMLTPTPFGNYTWNYLVVDGLGMYVDLMLTRYRPMIDEDDHLLLPFALSKKMLLDLGYQESPGRPFPDVMLPEHYRLYHIFLAPPRDSISDSDDRSS